jgi:hypothetical protein
MKIVGVYAIFVGLMMFGQWAFFLLTGQVPELQSETWRIAMHLAAEFVTAAGLIAAGVALLRRATWGMKAYLFFAGMLAYSVIASPGYFAQQGQWLLVGIFALLLILTLFSAVKIASSR